MSLASSKRKRGVVRASLTKLGTKLADLERKTDDPSTIDHAQRTLIKLDSLNSEFKVHHYSVVELAEDEDLEREQVTLDQHDDIVTDFSIRIERLLTACKAASTNPSSPPNLQLRKLQRLEQELSSIRDSVDSMDKDADNTCKLQLHQDQLSELKRELTGIRDALLSMGVADSDDLMAHHDRLEGKLFDQSLHIRELLRKRPNADPPSSSSTDHKVAKLPKLSVPMFNGDILGWQTFWEQFNVAVHESTHISNAEKLVYLRQALKDGSARTIIEGLSHSGEQYEEAVECLRVRYDRPRLIHQAHVRKILEVPSLKDGNGKELRRFHDVMQQHIRALKTMGHEPPGSFLTSLLELKLDGDTAFEWQKHSQSSSGIPPYTDLLKFVDLRALASEVSSHDSGKKSNNTGSKSFKNRSFNSFVADVNSQQCVVCKDKHPLYSCAKFKTLSHDQKLSTVRGNRLCMNCFSGDHFIKNCKSNHRCKRCQKPHHTLLHAEDHGNQQSPANSNSSSNSEENPVTSNTATGLNVDALMMTCRVLISNHDGSSVEARALLDSASSASFVSERLAQVLHLPRSKHGARITGIAGLSHGSPTQFVTTLTLSAIKSSSHKIGVTAIIVPQVTCELPHHPIEFDSTWSHLSNIHLADPYFGQPGRIDVLLGVEVFAQVVRNGRRTGPPGSPVAFETEFGWVLAGEVQPSVPCYHITSHHVALENGDDLLRRFWEIEQQPDKPIRSPEEESVIRHFQENHFRANDGRFIVPLPRRADARTLGESRSQAVRRFNNLERSLHSKSRFTEVNTVIQEYLDLEHAEPVPEVDLHKPTSEVFYMPVHVVWKETSSTTKVRAVFDASAKSSSGVSLNETFLVGPTVHPPLIDVLLRFRSYRVALTTDVSKMYRAVGLIAADKDLHRFLWRSSQTETLRDYRMTRVTFGVSASSFAVNMSLLHNANELAHEFPLAAKAVLDSFYVDDGLTGADSVSEALALRGELQELFARGQFLLRKWRSNNLDVLNQIAPELRELQLSDPLTFSEEYSKTLGLEWNSQLDVFRITVSDLPSLGRLTKRALVSDVAKIFDVLGWYAPTIIKMKILLQKVWESRVEWDDLIPEAIQEIWSHWRSELPVLTHHHISRCYFPLDFYATAVQLHGFSDASEDAYAGVVYIRFTDDSGHVHLSLITSKTKVSPIKRLTIPRLELCGALLLSKLLCHVREVLSIPLSSVFGWTDSTIVLHWMSGDPRRLKTYVGNRISSIVDRIPPGRWKHVKGTENPADCASRGLFPQELKDHSLWWNGPPWLQLPPGQWPVQPSCFPCEVNDEETKNVSMHMVVVHHSPIIPYDRISSFSRLKRVTAWVFRFVRACQRNRPTASVVTVEELTSAERYWLSMMQKEQFSREIRELKSRKAIASTSPLLTLRPLLDSHGLVRVGGRRQLSKVSPSQIHPVILHKKHLLTKLIVRAEHLRLLHAGPTLVMSSLHRRYHIIGGRQLVRQICRECVICRRVSARPVPQLLGQLPPERVTPGPVFSKVGVDYAGPISIKYGYVRKPVVVKAYICVFVSLTVKAVHLEVVSDLTTDAFLAALRRFIARRGKPTLIWSDNGSNFIGADHEIKTLFKFLRQQKTESVISRFCSIQGIEWKFIPQHSPHFGGLWEAAVKSTKRHLKRVISDVKLTFEEMSTVLAQIEAVLNSRPLAPLSGPDEALEPLTPGHFLIGQPLESLPDPSTSFQSFTLLRRWQLCQNLVRHFWTRWSREYLVNLDKISKWKVKSRNLAVGDVVVLREDGLIPLKWQLARVENVHPGLDGVVRVATIKTQTGTYKRPVTKLALLISD